ncbi:hypothetical protein LTR36_007327 [Oleoguttula mirabilis]|uniref:Uncharacterized protein n=1 Tax=Oleoguttula mirabilis TaxID=1507867 RepID=A0AAV9J9J8_9PEZI|nr:hypothetical protein LTR36_007327 [Oleoguttula mirabilis]
MGDTQQLSLALKTQAKRDNDLDITDNVCAEIKSLVIFQYNCEKSLSANLIACGDMGRLAFMEAETGLRSDEEGR